MSFLDAYLARAERLYKSAHASAPEQKEKLFAEKAKGDRSPRWQIRFYMVDRMVNYHRRAVEWTSRAIDQRDASTPPPIKWMGQRNQKLRRYGILAWNLPAGHSCPYKGDCFGPCYALHGHYTMNPHMIRTMISNWAASDRADFTERLSSLIRETPKTEIFRIHDSGDFYCQKYVDDWTWVVRQHPERLFYAYTKAFHGLNMGALEREAHVSVIRSLGGAHDSKVDMELPHARIFRSHDELEQAGYVDGSESEWPAISGETRIGLVVHGRRKNFWIPSDKET